MGQRAWYVIKENGIETNLYAHWGANEVTPLWRTNQAEVLAKNHQISVTEALKNIKYDGEFTKNTQDTDNVFGDSDPINDWKSDSYIEMKITIDMDIRNVNYEYNNNYYARPHANFDVDLDQATALMYSETQRLGLQTPYQMADRFEHVLRENLDENLLDSKINAVVDYIIINGVKQTESGNYIESFDELSQRFGFDVAEYSSEIADALSSRDEVADVVVEVDGMDVCYNLDYCQNAEVYAEDMEESELEQELTGPTLEM